MNIIAPLGTCGWAVDVLPGEVVHRCGATAIRTVELKLPAEPAPGVVVEPDQRDVRLGVCPDHERLVQELSHGPDSVVPADPFERFGPLAEVVPLAHRGHTTVALAAAGCIGCDIDFGAAHTRTTHG